MRGGLRGLSAGKFVAGEPRRMPIDSLAGKVAGSARDGRNGGRDPHLRLGSGTSLADAVTERPGNWPTPLENPPGVPTPRSGVSARPKGDRKIAPKSRPARASRTSRSAATRASRFVWRSATMPGGGRSVLRPVKGSVDPDRLNPGRRQGATGCTLDGLTWLLLRRDDGGKGVDRLVPARRSSPCPTTRNQSSPRPAAMAGVVAVRADRDPRGPGLARRRHRLVGDLDARASARGRIVAGLRPSDRP